MRQKKKGEKENMQVQDKLHDCYIWHIITLAKMKYKLKTLKEVK
jgi:hypothetical protein